MTLLTTDFSNSRAMIIDGSPMTRAILTSQFREFGFEKVTQCTSLSEAREQFSDGAFDGVLCEHNFGNETPTGIDLVDELRSQQMLPMSTVVFMLTGEASFARVAEAAETGWTATCSNRTRRTSCTSGCAWPATARIRSAKSLAGWR